jgi:hypothetical protein
MAEDRAAPDETEALRERVAKLESDLRAVQTVLGRCVLTTMAASFLAKALGHEHAAVVESAGLSPSIAPLLTQLDKQLDTLIRSFEEAAHGG